MKRKPYSQAIGKLIQCLLFILLLPVVKTQSAQALPAKPQSDFFRGARWALDTGSRTQTHDASSLKMMNFAGFDFYSDLYFGGKHRGDLVAQVYLFDMRTLSADESERNARFDYAPCVIAPNIILLPQGRLNLKIGHMWHAYGLRNQINTTQTLRQMISQDNMGLMLDWGAELHGELSIFTYNVSLGSGSGKWFSRANDTYMGVARLGIHGDYPALGNLPVQVGFSGLSARIQSPQGLIERWRAGADLQYEGPIGILLEGSLGEDESIATSYGDPREALSLFAEIHWKSSTENWIIYFQQRYLSLTLEPQAFEIPADAMLELEAGQQGMLSLNPMMESSILEITDRQESSTFGVLHTPFRSFYVAGEVVLRSGTESSMARLQIRYRW